MVFAKIYLLCTTSFSTCAMLQNAIKTLLKHYLLQLSPQPLYSLTYIYYDYTHLLKLITKIHSIPQVQLLWLPLWRFPAPIVLDFNEKIFTGKCDCHFRYAIHDKYFASISPLEIQWYASLVPHGKYDNTTGPLARYVKLRISHVPGMPGPFSPRVSDACRGN